MVHLQMNSKTLLKIAIIFTAVISIIFSLSMYMSLNNKNAEALQQTIFFFSAAQAFFLLLLLWSLSEIWRSDKKLDQKRARDEAILVSIGEGIFGTDKEGKIIVMNQAAQNLLGFRFEELQGRRLYEVIVMENEKGELIYESERPIIQSLATGNRISGVYHYYKRDKSKFPVGVTVTPIFLANDLIGAIEVFKDVAKEREIERLKDEFVSIASHELRTPMTAIKGLVSMIFEGEYGAYNENLKQPLTDIAISTNRLIALVNDLLNISRIEGGRVRFTLAPFSLFDIVHQVISTLQPLTEQKEITLKVSQIPGIPVQADADKVTQILNNIVGNAIKFTDSGGIMLSAQVREEKEMMYILVTDTGIGISQGDQRKLFGKFEQIHSQTNGRPPGTGLGLYISRELARKMGGDLWIERSEVGKGTTFGYSLPLANSKKADTIKREIEREAQVHPDQK
ncbi:MAG: PAS domain-containing protein [Candidatus Levybacteria bacterium]|nr:PAS domain-containing protein [Candidatus Levybacteria bacterium]